MLRFHGSRDKVTYEQVGYNCRLDELQAAILRVQLPHVDALGGPPQAGRRAGTPTPAWASWAGLPRATAGADPAWHLYVIRHDALRRARARAAGGRDRRARLLPRAGAPAAGDGDVVASGDVSLPGTDEAARTHLAIPISAAITPRAGARGRAHAIAAMRIWVDLTNSPHVLVLRPVVERLRAAAHDVRVTARDFAQTVRSASASGCRQR